MRTVTIKFDDDNSVAIDCSSGMSANIEPDGENDRIGIFYPGGETEFYTLHRDDAMVDVLARFELL